MKQSLKDFFEGVSIKNTIFLIIWTAGILGWIYFAISFTATRAEASQTWTHVQQIQNKDVGDSGRKTESFAQSDKEESGGEVSMTDSTPSEVEKLILEIFGEDEYKTARAVAFAESRLNPKAIGKNNNGTTDCGVFQINSIHGLEDCTDPHTNIEYAKQLFDRSGWRPWVAYTTGKYLAYQ